MPARASLVLKDQAGTPADHTFTPDRQNAQGVHLFSEKTGVQIADPQFSAAKRDANGRYRVSLKVKVPVVQTQTINGIANPVLVRYAEVNLQTSFDASSTPQERKDAIAFMRNALSNTGNTMMYTFLTEAAEDIYG